MEMNSAAAQASPYERKEPTHLSKYLYLYYLRHDPDTTAAYLVKFSSRLTMAEAIVEIEKIAAKLRSGEPVEGYKGARIGIVEWKHKSFFAVILDDAHEKLVRNNAVSFEFEGGNHTFKDGVDISGLDTGSTGFVCINHMKDKTTGNDLEEGDREEFRVAVNHNKSGNRNDKSIMSHADSGTNTGPPVP